MNMLKGLAQFVVLLVACSLSSCTATNGSATTANAPAQTPGEKTTVQADEPKLVISVEHSEWARGGPLWVTLEIHNPGKTDINGIASLTLVKQPGASARDSLWAPILLQETSVTSAPGPRPSLVKAGQELTLKVDVQQLKWARSIQSSWPDQDLFTVGSAGDYSLSLEIHTKDGKTVAKLESNKVRVSLN